MSPRDIREIRIVFDDLSARSADPEEGGEVVHRVEPSIRRYSPEEIPEGQRGSGPRPFLPHPPATLYCRGPLEIRPISMGLLVSFDYNDAEAGAEGEKLAPGHAALQDRPLTPSNEPNQILISHPDANWPVEDLILHGFSLSVVANLLSRSDYVVPLFATLAMPQAPGLWWWFASTTDLGYEGFSPFSP